MFLDSSEEFFFIPSISCEEFFFNGRKLEKKWSNRSPNYWVCTVLLPIKRLWSLQVKSPASLNQVGDSNWPQSPWGKILPSLYRTHCAHTLTWVFSDPPRWPPQVVRSRYFCACPCRLHMSVNHTCATLNTNGKF